MPAEVRVPKFVTRPGPAISTPTPPAAIEAALSSVLPLTMAAPPPATMPPAPPAMVPKFATREPPPRSSMPTAPPEITAVRAVSAAPFTTTALPAVSIPSPADDATIPSL